MFNSNSVSISYLDDPVLWRASPLPLENCVNRRGLSHGHGFLVGNVPLLGVLVQFVVVKTLEWAVACTHNLCAILL